MSIYEVMIILCDYYFLGEGRYLLFSLERKFLISYLVDFLFFNGEDDVYILKNFYKVYI